MAPDNLCGRRKRLYQAQLDATRGHFGDVLKGQSATNAKRLKPALTDPGLIDALEQILNVYAIYGVQRDLARLRTNDVLFLSDPDKRPPLDDVLPSGGTVPTYQGGDPTDAKTAANKQRAYVRYFKWYIEPKKITGPDGKARSGVDAFYERYPLLWHGVQQVTANHQMNIEQACTRVAAGWDAGFIEKFFLPRKPTQMTGIKTTGSDFHKGGKQVLILTFSLDDKSPARLVYKPSSVEVDCRIAGDTSFVNGCAPQGYSQTTSVVEIINKFNPPGPRPGGFTAVPLPTYKILPFNRTSVPDAYGYIEFLTRQPEVSLQGVADNAIPHALEQAVASLHPDDVKTSDWVTTDPQDGMVFFHQLGALMAIATAFSFTDVHIQNAIAHKRLPHLIDLEEALKQPMNGVADTKMGEWLDTSWTKAGTNLWLAGDQTSDLSGYVGPPGDPEPAPCALYLVDDSGSAERMSLGVPKGADRILGKSTRARRNRIAASAGFSDVVEALADPGCNTAVQAWVQELASARTVARYVTRATAEYARTSRDLYELYCEESIPDPSDDDTYKNFKFTPPGATDPKFFFSAAVSYNRSTWEARLAAAANRPPGGWPPPPFFAAEHPAHAWRDYLNCDVPSFYHVLDSQDVLNSAGATVNVKDAVKWQADTFGDDAGSLPNGWAPRADGAYLPQTPIDMIGGQLSTLQTSCATPKGLSDYLGQILKGAGLRSDFSPVARATQGKAGSSGA